MGPTVEAPGACISIRPWLSDRPCTLSPEPALERAQGALLGLAIGDAVGTTLEFQRRDEGHVSDMVVGGPFCLAPGEWIEDTSMALCLADTYASQGKFDFVTFAKVLVHWCQQSEISVNGRCFDIGNVTCRALEGWEAQGLGWMGNLEASAAGNGSLIRLALTATYQHHSLLATWWGNVT
ncbi:TPA: ADP-ribosylglycohydrolase family protein [Stenotrophomonas maltophilia]|nr:ADP-ribosylglycohydrolase family protein [Stenotrophomonas maltophilia]HDS1154649.1 ADP-ribosylglycohydrolase family protein [Stenotrophomonas maltophilia]HDS1167506.1 ADP-ribosylglycohydrolase family protein [Stenotrophomonas maltophilia]HDS1170652.1 ADP-ribosylglycohydrolase family protein [Stenotrophomonas maltophilia]HDS1177316.1 ADP-ribosylglycohydrolase family protein [Stenotrophomonas maltophilia]